MSGAGCPGDVAAVMGWRCVPVTLIAIAPVFTGHVDRRLRGGENHAERYACEGVLLRMFRGDKRATAQKNWSGKRQKRETLVCPEQ